MTLGRRQLIGGLGAATLACAARPLRADEALRRAQARGTAVFDEAWTTVRDRFYDPTMRGLDWSAIGARYRPDYANADTDAARAAVIKAMIAELGVSHMGYFTPDEPAYYQLADIFLRNRRDVLRRYFPNGEISYPGIGIFTAKTADGREYITGVIDGATAWQAGLTVGDEIIAVDGRAFEPVVSFRGKGSVTMTVRSTAGAPTVDLNVAVEQIKPNTLFQRGLESSVRIIPAPGGRKIGYVHVWSYASPAYQQSLERILADGPLKDADALIWDLRDGWGGAQIEYLDVFARGPSVQTAGRDGRFVTRTARWRKPVALLINGGARSGKEILAYGFKKYGMGEVIGTTTAKDVLAATAFVMSDGSLLEVAVNDVLVDGERIEAVGVTPTIEVPFDRLYAAGRDPQLARAVEVLARPRTN